MSSNHHKTFLDRYLNGEVLADDIDDFIDRWHAGPSDQELHDFLGLSREEYSLWLRNPEALPHIARSRREGVPLDVIVERALGEQPMAARSSDAAKIKRLKHWLEMNGKLG
jgi:hypothetical protein